MYVVVSIYIFTYIYNGNFRLFAKTENGKWKFVFLGRQTINGTVIDDCCFSKRGHLYWYGN
jgi:hypothetical protein